MAKDLHARYVPVLRFARGEQFFPMAVEDFVGYCSLRRKRVSTALLNRGRVNPSLLGYLYREEPDVYLQSVPASLADQNVASRWSADVLRSLQSLSYKTASTTWQLELAKVAYRWFSDRTQSATKLFWWNDLVMALLGAGKDSQGDLPRLDLPPEIREAAIKNYVHSQPLIPHYTYYHRIVPDRRYLCLQYWFFYAFNDWATGFGGMNDHEGDWEAVYLFFNQDSLGQPQEPPAFVTFVGHHSRITKRWGHPDVTMDGTHPVAYVAAGSHASYPERKPYDLMAIYGLVDYAMGDGLTINPGDWKRHVDLDTQPWTLAFLGAWGTRYWLPLSWAKQVLGVLQSKADEFGLPGVSAPRGPRYAEDATVRPNWISAVDWAGILHLERD